MAEGSLPGETMMETPAATAQETAQEILSEEERVLVGYIKVDSTITRKTLAEKMNVSSDHIKRRLEALKKKCGHCHVGSTKKGRWVFDSNKKGSSK